MDEIINSLNNLTLEDEKDLFLSKIKEIFELYITHGCRSSKKVDLLHNFIKELIEKSLVNKDGYNVKVEENIPSYNASGNKRCDIVLYKNNNIIAIFPVKFIMSNYYQNKNNMWENLTGECIHIQWKNPNIKIIPINIIFNKIPYLEKSNKIKNLK